MPRKKLTDPTLRNLKKAAAGDRYETMDTLIGGFGIRVNDKGHGTFILKTRYPGHSGPTRRALGEYPAMSLEAARAKAAEWLTLMKQGKDPADVEERARLAAQEEKDKTFAKVAEDFLREKVATERSARAVEREIADLITPLGNLPIGEITDLHVLKIIKAKAQKGGRTGEGAPVAARNLLALAKRFFGWAIDQRVYGIRENPCRGMSATKIIGESAFSFRDRTLADDELRALWRAAGRLGPPYGAAYRMLLLTCLRVNEAADAAYPEFDPAVVRALRQRKDGEAVDWSKLAPEQFVWTIPAARMKGKDAGKRQALPHAVPLTPDILALLESLPRQAGPFLFSTDGGNTPTWLGDKVKKKLDELMLGELREMARERGDDLPETLQHWENRDLRRTVRTRLSRLKVPEEAREAIQAHVRPGVKRNYDWHTYLPEKREGLEKWAAALRLIITPPESNVVALVRETA